MALYTIRINSAQLRMLKAAMIHVSFFDEEIDKRINVFTFMERKHELIGMLATVVPGYDNLNDFTE